MLANLVEYQYDLIDNISHNVSSTMTDMDHANSYIIPAKRIQENGNCVLIIIIIFIFSIIIISVLLGSGGIGTVLGIYFGLKK